MLESGSRQTAGPISRAYCDGSRRASGGSPGGLSRYRHGHAGNLDVDRAEVGAAREIEGLPVVSAERHVGGCRLAVHDAAEFLAARVHDPDAARAAAINIAFDVDLHAVGHTGLVRP